MTRTIKVSVTSDIICPWCYIGAKELDAAIARVEALPEAPKVQVEYKPFLLDPSLPEACKDKVSHYCTKFGAQRFEGMTKLVGERGKQCGINFQFGGPIAQTVNAHRLLMYAYRKGGQEMQQPLLRRMFELYFEEKGDIFSTDALVGCASELGIMSRDEALALLNSSELLQDLALNVAEAQALGIAGVPFTVVEGRWAVSGGQSADVFYSILSKVVDGGSP